MFNSHTNKGFNLKLENNLYSSILVVRRYMEIVFHDDFKESLSWIYYCGGDQEFHIGQSYMRSDNLMNRDIGDKFWPNLDGGIISTQWFV